MALEALLGFDLPPLALVVAALFAILVVRSWVQTPGNLPPFPARPFPILGHLPYLGAATRDKLLELRKRTDEIFSLYLGGTLVIFLSGYDVMREALVKQAEYFTDRPLGGPSSLLLIQNGIVGASGSIWKENRTAVVQILKEFGVGRDIMSQKITEEIQLYLAHLEGLAGKASDVREITTCAVTNITCNILIGKRFAYDDSAFMELLHQLGEFMSLIEGGAMHQFFPQLQYLPGDLFNAKTLLKLDAEIMDKMAGFIKNTTGEGEDGEGNHSNLISAYIDKMNAKQSAGQNTVLSMKELERVAFDMMIGGSETSASTLLWFYLYMVHFPDIQEKFYQEIVTEIGTSKTPTGQDKVKLSYVNAVILETQRLASISPLAVTHRCTKETTVRGYTIPKDVIVILHLDSVMWDENIWDDAMNFKPERFLKDGKLFCPDHFVAFGMGRRSCPGESLAKMELFLFTVSLIQRFRIVPADPNCLPPRTYIKGATCPPTPFSVRFIERDTK
ncbi:cytochrome p450 ii f2-like protein ii [Plakobranchus ocellatus]|uniref:Cytochrome p450 ii f2-like protein ii n=1 Tax=Plakobranchus ocellatus TaxID=259542 RepID=A0AAV4CTY2_9GAST|nr:cytochrome p450 ii f2-like protein ii [Plakobranchus ocellatus]